MSKLNKEKLRKLIAKDQLQEVIDALLEWTGSSGRQDLYDEVLIQSARYEQYAGEKRSGTTKKEDLDILRANIRGALLSIIKAVDEPESGLQGKAATLAGQRILPTSRDQDSVFARNKLSLALGAVFTLLIFFTVIFLPCPTDIQYSVFRIILSIGVAGLAAVIPGFFQLRYKNLISAGGALGIFVLVYALNPALVGTLNNCGEPFNYTIFLESEVKKPDFAGKFPGNLKIQLDNEIKKVEIDANGAADFKNIPSKFQDQEIPAELEFEGWQFAGSGSDRSRCVLTGKSTTLKIEPDGSLSKVFGSVRDENDQFISGAKVSVGELSTLTDDEGAFSLEIPLEYQQEEQDLTVFQKGYEIYNRKVYPGLKKAVPVKLSRVQ